MSRINVLSIVGFVLSFFIPIAGLVCSIIGLKQSKAVGDDEGRGFAIAGIIISSVELAAYVLAIVAFVCMIVLGIGLALPFIPVPLAA